MLRAPQIRTCCGSLRPLVPREPPAGACSQPKCATWPDGRAATAWTPLFTDTLSFPTCKPSLNSDSLSQRLKAVRILDYFINGTCFPSRRRLWDTRPTSLGLTTKTGCYFQRLAFVRAFSLLAQHPGTFDHFHSKSRWLALPPTRAASQAESHVTGAWRDCLSAENESRCRQSLVSNLRFYEENRDGRWMSSRKNQARWASVLVALCSVQGEPAFLFTLRSSKLKGRHKGDVRSAEGSGWRRPGRVKFWVVLTCDRLAALREERTICRTGMWWPRP